MQILRVTSQDLHASVFKFLRIDEHTTAVVVALEGLRSAFFNVVEGILMNLDVGSSCASLTSILESSESQPSAYPREEGQLTITYNSHFWVVGFKFAFGAAIVPASAEAKVRATGIHIAGNASIAFAIQCTTVSQVCPSRKYEKRARAEPRLFDDNIAGDWDDSIVWRQKSPQCEDAVANGFSRAAISYPFINTTFEMIRDEAEIPE